MGARTVLRVLQTCRRGPGGVVARMSPQGAPAHSWEWGRSSLQFPKEARVYPQMWVGGSTFELPYFPPHSWFTSARPTLVQGK